MAITQYSNARVIEATRAADLSGAAVRHRAVWFGRMAARCRAGLAAALVLALWSSAGQATESRGFTTVSLPDGGGKVDFYERSYALVIGVSNYTSGWPDLESVPGELDRVERALESRGYTVFRYDDPQGDELARAFGRFIDEFGYDEKNRLLFFYSGHGYTRREGRKGYLVPADAPSPVQDERAFLRSALSMTQILAWARQIESRHALFLFDSCFSGTVFTARALPGKPPHITRLSAEPVRQFITAGSAGEEVPAASVFTPAFIDALEHGLGDLDKDGYMTGTELGLYLQSKVPVHSAQTPQFGKISDYELARGDYVFNVGLTDTAPASTPGAPPPPPLVGHLQVNVNAPDARVYVNEKFIGEASPGHPLNRSGVAPGLASVRVEALGYEPKTERVKIEPNQWSQAMLALSASFVAPSMVPVKGGCFQMGSPESESGRYDNERLHRVCVEDFSIGAFEVTFEEYDAFARATGRKTPGGAGKDRGRLPAINLSWHDAVAYTAWLSGLTGKRFRLPTEAEWEYAARAGKSATFSSGRCIDTDAANYNGREGYADCGVKGAVARERPLTVGSLEPNAWGLYDLHGNVWEWTCSGYDEGYRGGERRCAGNDADYRVVRGGSWFNGPRFLRSAKRSMDRADRRDRDLGFRLVADP